MCVSTGTGNTCHLTLELSRLSWLVWVWHCFNQSQDLGVLCLPALQSVKGDLVQKERNQERKKKKGKKKKKKEKKKKETKKQINKQRERKQTRKRQTKKRKEEREKETTKKKERMNERQIYIYKQECQAI